MNRIFETDDKKELNYVKELFLENEIEFEILYEHRVYPELNYDSNGFAYVRIAQKDTLKANHLLHEHELKAYIDPEELKFGFFIYLDRLTENLPVLKRFSPTTRVPIFMGLVSILVVGCGLAYLSLKISGNIFDEVYCVRHIEHRGELFIDENPFHKMSKEEQEMWTKIPLKNNREIQFKDRQVIELPFGNKGFVDFVTDHTVIILSTEKNSEVYKGRYELDINFDGDIDMISKNTKISLTRCN